MTVIIQWCEPCLNMDPNGPHTYSWKTLCVLEIAGTTKERLLFPFIR